MNFARLVTLSGGKINQLKQNTMKARTNLNRNYYDVNHYLNTPNDVETGSIQWYRAIKKSGYKYLYSWINSDNNWTWFAKTQAQAIQGAAELFAREKQCDIKHAKKYYTDRIDIQSIDYIINEYYQTECKNNKKTTKKYNFFYDGLPIPKAQFVAAAPENWENELVDGEYSFGYYRACVMD